jgi:methylase of polypeptide subunit release factors
MLYGSYPGTTITDHYLFDSIEPRLASISRELVCAKDCLDIGSGTGHIAISLGLDPLEISLILMFV